jgi:hypothetical protein
VVREEVGDRDSKVDDSSELKGVMPSGYDRMVSILQFSFVWQIHRVDSICSRTCYRNFVYLRLSNEYNLLFIKKLYYMLFLQVSAIGPDELLAEKTPC